MNVKYEKKPEMTFIGYHTEIRPEEGYQNCEKGEMNKSKFCSGVVQ